MYSHFGASENNGGTQVSGVVSETPPWCGLKYPSNSIRKKGEMIMKNNEKIRIIEKETEYRPRIYSINGVSGFWKHARYENCWIYNGRLPVCNCWVFSLDDWVEIHNVIVHELDDRGNGHGSAMIADIRTAFPDKHIWVNTGECSRGFWEKMSQRGFIDSIENEYWWPCMDTACTTCHPSRATGRRRAMAW